MNRKAVEVCYTRPMQQTCKKCQAGFEIFPDEEAFLGKIGFKFNTTTIHPPLPVLCPDCRLKARVCQRNERAFYKRPSSLSGKDIVSLHHEDAPWGKPYTVYGLDEWHSDKFNPMQYGRKFDFNRP